MTFLLPFLIAYLIVGVTVWFWILAEGGLYKESLLVNVYFAFSTPLLWLPSLWRWGYKNGFARSDYNLLMARRSAQDLELYGC